MVKLGVLPRLRLARLELTSLLGDWPFSARRDATKARCCGRFYIFPHYGIGISIRVSTTDESVTVNIDPCCASGALAFAAACSEDSNGAEVSEEDDRMLLSCCSHRVRALNCQGLKLSLKIDKR